MFCHYDSFNNNNKLHIQCFTIKSVIDKIKKKQKLMLCLKNMLNTSCFPRPLQEVCSKSLDHNKQALDPHISFDFTYWRVIICTLVPLKITNHEFTEVSVDCHYHS